MLLSAAITSLITPSSQCLYFSFQSAKMRFSPFRLCDNWPKKYNFLLPIKLFLPYFLIRHMVLKCCIYEMDVEDTTVSPLSEQS